MSDELLRFAERGIIRRVLIHGNFTPGSTHVIRLSDVLLDKFDRAAHVAFLRLDAGFGLTTVAASMAEAEGARAAKLVFRDIKLRLAGHDHFDGVDGLDVNRYVSHLQGVADPFAPGGSSGPSVSIPDADGTPSISANLHIPFIGAMGCPQRMERLAPAKLLLDQDAYLGFTVASTLAAGVTVTSCTSMELAIGLVYRDDIEVYTPWKLRAFETTELEAMIRPVGGLEFLTLCSRAGSTTAATRSHADYVLESLRVQGEDVLTYPNQTRTSWEARRAMFEPGQLVGESIVRSGEADKWDLITTPAVDRRVTKMVRGDIQVKLSAVPSAFTRHRYLYCETGVSSPAHTARVRKALGLSKSYSSRTRAPRMMPLAEYVGTAMSPTDYPARVVASKATK